ncbi:hypothetical protein BJ912DRAFT_977800 [Pholiota molesta]|nr:hypothetical protein BJ912DRAFT_977800 [Pholiota molesta]
MGEEYIIVWEKTPHSQLLPRPPVMSSTVRLIWKCSQPRSQAMVQLCESLMTKAALAYGMDTAIIRKEVHNTTRIGGRYVKTVPHITGDVVNSQNQTGYALHYNLDTSDTSHAQPLADLPPTAPNPEVWKLEFKAGKGFVLVGDPTETVREVE